MKVLVLGAGGQVGRAVVGRSPNSVSVTGLDRRSLDVTDRDQLARAMHEIGPDVVVNCSAYTKVDDAESDPGLAHAINCEAVGKIVETAHATGARCVHLSTDFVFNGHSSRPYSPGDPTEPLNVYGGTKRAGELQLGPEDLLVRSAWIYDGTSRNFVTTMLRLMREREELGVVCDQVGTPTFTNDLADALWRLIECDAKGTLHYTNAGVASWYDFAVAIFEEATNSGALQKDVFIRPIKTEQFTTAARRPAFSVLDCSTTYELLGEPARHWRAALRTALEPS